MRVIDIILFGILAFCYIEAAGQGRYSTFGEEDNRTFYGGLTAGANISEVIGDAYHGYHKVGLNAGALVYAKFSARLGASIELLLSQKGSRGVRELYSSYVGNMFEKYYLDLNYVEVPLQLHFFPQEKIDIGAGASYSRLVNVKEDIATEQPVYINPDNHPFLKDDFAFVVGGSYRFWKNWMVSGRYQRSFTAIRNWDKVPLYLGSGNQYNIYFTFRVVYFF